MCGERGWVIKWADGERGSGAGGGGYFQETGLCSRNPGRVNGWWAGGVKVEKRLFLLELDPSFDSET